MATHDITIPPQQLQRLQDDFAALEAKLEPLLPVFAKIMQSEAGAIKIRQIIREHPDAEWIRLWVQSTRKWFRWLEAIQGGEA